MYDFLIGGIMLAKNRWIIALLIIISMLLVSIAYGQNTGNETPNTTISENSPQEVSDEELVKSGGLFPIEDMHRVIREERLATFQEIDLERKATLEYLTNERKAVVDELKRELSRVTDLLQSERRLTVVEMEAISSRITENAVLKSEKLIDHFFIRAFQFALVIIFSVGITGFIIFRIIAKNNGRQQKKDVVA
jgi:hypothetical protein